MINKTFRISSISLLLILLISACAVSPVTTDNQSVASSSTQSSENSIIPAATKPVPSIISQSQSGSGDLKKEELTYVDLYNKVNPSVVSVSVLIKSSQSSADTGFFQQIPDQGQTPDSPSQETYETAEGSGFIYDTEGHIITNNHVVEEADKITVTFADGSQAAATVVGTDPATDLAVIKVDVDPSLLTPVTLGDSESLQVGQIVVAIGNPFGLEGSMSTGIVSGLSRLLTASETLSINGANFSIPDVIQTDAAINPGNSGGPLLNLSGEVIGITTAIESPVKANSGVGYAVPAAIIKNVVPTLISDGSITHPWIGISGTTMNADYAKAMNLDTNTRGVLVAEVVKDSPADKAGLIGSSTETTIDGLTASIGGDIITAIDGNQVKIFDDLLGYLMVHTHIGDSVTLTILRNGTPMDVQLTLSARPNS